MNEVLFIVVSSILTLLVTAGLSIAVLQATDHTGLTILSGSAFAMLAYVAACFYLRRVDRASIRQEIASVDSSERQEEPTAP